MNDTSNNAANAEKRYHDKWLGMVQPIEGLVFSVPVLVDAGAMERTGPDAQETFRAQLIERDKRLCMRDVAAFLQNVLGFAADAFDVGDAIAPSLCHFVPEGKQTMTPTMVLRKPGSSCGSNEAEMLLWQVPDGLDLDRAETVTGP